eukprot:10617002-Alexandrium_andersonii.AAC.1
MQFHPTRVSTPGPGPRSGEHRATPYACRGSRREQRPAATWPHSHAKSKMPKPVGPTALCHADRAHTH